MPTAGGARGAHRRPVMRRIVVPAVLAALAVTAALTLAAAFADVRLGSPAPAQVDAVQVVGMTVTDLARSVRFFRETLDCELLDEGGLAGSAYDRLWELEGVRARRARLRLGREILELVEFAAPGGRPFPADTRSNDRAFQHVAIVVADMAAAYARVRGHVVPISTDGPQTLPVGNAAAAGIAAFYFRDPDGHALELIHFPPGKGEARWHDDATGRLFLGIDHTAIAVRSTATSVAFYRDVLGFTIAGESLNVGIEQERLTGVAGAEVRITALRPPAVVPGIELLDYRAPADGRDAASEPRTNDVMHWYTRVVVRDVDGAARAVRARHGRVSDVVALSDRDRDPTRAVVARDPDGHTVELVER